MKKCISVLLILMCVCSLVFAQGAKEASSETSETGAITGEITFMTSVENAQNPELERAAREFEAMYPGTKVTFEPLVSSEIVSKFSTAALAGAGPDIVSVDNNGWPISLAAMGLIEPLTDRLATTENDYLPGTLNAGLYEGELYSVPWYYNNTGLYYNKTILKEIGYDNPPNTWEEFEDCVKKATELGYSAITSNLDGYHVFNFFMAQENSVIDTSGEIPVVTVNDESGKIAFNFYAGLQEKYNAFPESMKEATTWAKAYTPFIQGECLFLICGDWGYKTIKSSNPDLDFGIAQMPIGKVRAACLGGNNLCINKNSDNFETAWAFIQYLTSKECDYVAFSQARIPARSDVDYTEVLAMNPDYKVFLDNGPYTVPRPLVVNATKVDQLVSAAFSKVLFGIATPQEALDTLEVELNEFVQENYL